MKYSWTIVSQIIIVLYAVKWERKCEVQSVNSNIFCSYLNNC